MKSLVWDHTNDHENRLDTQEIRRTHNTTYASAVARRTTRAGFYFLAEIFDISPKTGFTGYNRYFINTERIFPVFTNYVQISEILMNYVPI
jgi:hypothetical protein